jgi:tetratricopeptide (TPR) repeat protein
MKIVGALAALAAVVPTGLDQGPTWLGIGYICGAEHFAAGQAPRRLVMLPGMGSAGFVAPAGTAEAQRWLSYGLKLYHAFYHDDAKAAFARAAQADPNCSLCASGEAIGLGPTLNFWVSAQDTSLALAAANRAARLARTPLERDLAAALVHRYAPNLPQLERAKRYGDEMAALSDRYPDEPELASLAAHALLIPTLGHDLGGVPRAMAILERALARDPNDTAAIHYYIHASEYAGRPADALPYAERLASLAPEASHLVHMAAHTLFRVGRYEDVAVVNARAMKVDADYAQAMDGQGPLGGATYYAHNMMFGVAGALMAGDRDLSLKYADHTPVAFPAGTDAFRRSIVSARTLVAYGRYAPDKALTLPAPAASDPQFHLIYWRYARGEAQAALGNAPGVLEESRRLAAITVPDGGGIPDLRAIAVKVLAARAAMLTSDPAKAADLYAEAASLQEKAFANVYDPPPWWYPIRRSVAAARLKAGDARAAALEARASLAAWPRDGLALRVLAQAERQLGDAASAERDRALARKAWRGDVDAVSVDLI